MTLDFMFWAPDLFLVINLLGLLCYGITPGTTPFQEQIAVSTTSLRFAQNENGIQNRTLVWPENLRAKTQKKLTGVATSGPIHTSELLSLWAVILCVLGGLLIFYCPLYSVMAGGVFVRDAFCIQFEALVWFFGALVLIMGTSWQKTAGIVHPEFVTLTFLALLGQHWLICATDLISFYASLEIQSFSIIVLVSLNYRNAFSIEAGMKYFLLSAFSSSLLLIGIGLIYWSTGFTNCDNLVSFLKSTQDEPSIGLFIGVWLVSLGLLWKLSAAPLHLWVADVYQGAWTSVTYFLSNLPKIAVLAFWVHTWHPIWSAVFGNTLAVFSALSLLIGALAPLSQIQLKRLLALSSISHIGFILIALCVGTEAFAALWVYLILYLLTNAVFWGLLLCGFHRSQQKVSGPQFIWDLAMLNKTAPAIGAAWAIAMMSLAGLPPVAGFLGKLTVIWEATNGEQYALVAVALLSTLISTVYYLRLMKISYFSKNQQWSTYLQINSTNAYVISISSALLILLLWHSAPLILTTHWWALLSSFLTNNKKDGGFGMVAEWLKVQHC